MIDTQRQRYWLIALACFVSAQMALLMSLPNISAPGLIRIHHEQIKIAEPSQHDQVLRLTEDSVLTDFKQQAKWPSDTSAQYHFELDGSFVTDHGLTVYIPGVATPTRLSVNGAPAKYSSAQERVSTNQWPYFLWARVPQERFGEGPNRMDLVQFSRPRHIGIEAIYVSNTPSGDVIMAQWRDYRAALSSLLVMSVWIALLVCVIGLFLGRHKLGYVGGTLAAISVLIHFLPPEISWPLAPGGWGAVAVALAPIAGCLLLVAALQQRTDRAAAIAIGLTCASLPAAILALLTDQSIWQGSDPVLASSYAAAGLLPILIIGLPVLLAADARRYIGLLGHARQDIIRRDQIIAQKDQALHDEIRQKTIFEERQRFVRDVHDGIGGQLLSLLLRVRSGAASLEDVEQDIQDGIKDLRLVVDSLDHVGTNLAQAMSTFYARSSQQLKAANIELAWTQSDNLGRYQFDARKILNIYRIMQEAVSNCVKHSGARRLGISAQTLAGSDDLEITIADDGRGFAADTQRVGKGIDNMIARSEMLGAALILNSTQNGTTVVLRVPAKYLTKDQATHSSPLQK